MIRQIRSQKHRKIRPRSEPVWKVEPVSDAAASLRDLRGPELVALLDTAFSRIRAIEDQLMTRDR